MVFLSCENIRGKWNRSSLVLRGCFLIHPFPLSPPKLALGHAVKKHPRVISYFHATLTRACPEVHENPGRRRDVRFLVGPTSTSTSRGKNRGANINTRRSASRHFVKGPSPPPMGADAGVRLRFGILSTEIEPRQLFSLFFLPLFFILFLFSFAHLAIRARRARPVSLPSKSSLPTAQFFLRVETKHSCTRLMHRDACAP